MESSQKQKGTDQKYIESLRMTKGALHTTCSAPLCLPSAHKKLFLNGENSSAVDKFSVNSHSCFYLDNTLKKYCMRYTKNC